MVALVTRFSPHEIHEIWRWTRGALRRGPSVYRPISGGGGIRGAGYITLDRNPIPRELQHLDSAGRLIRRMARSRPHARPA
jgi:hypothetical protein